MKRSRKKEASLRSRKIKGDDSELPWLQFGRTTGGHQPSCWHLGLG
jgi:hypothetical protein